MCLIITQTVGAAAISRDAIRNAWDSNQDGAGFMFVRDSQLVIRKPYYKLKTLLAAYEKDFKTHTANSPFVLHFRYATHGDRTAVNVHPHELAGGHVGMVHNGILPFTPPRSLNRDDDISDTVWFARTVLAHRAAEDLTSEYFGKLLAEMIGTSNKLVFLDNQKRLSIVNESAGHWDGGNWFSNHSHESNWGWPSSVCDWRDRPGFFGDTGEADYATDTDFTDELGQFTDERERDYWGNICERIGN